MNSVISICRSFERFTLPVGKDLGKLEFEAFLFPRFISCIIQPAAFRVLSSVKYLLLKAQQVDSGPIDSTISDISMDSADTRLVH